MTIDKHHAPAHHHWNSYGLIVILLPNLKIISAFEYFRNDIIIQEKAIHLSTKT